MAENGCTGCLLYQVFKKIFDDAGFLHQSGNSHIFFPRVYTVAHQSAKADGWYAERQRNVAVCRAGAYDRDRAANAGDAVKSKIGQRLLCVRVHVTGAGAFTHKCPFQLHLWMGLAKCIECTVEKSIHERKVFTYIRAVFKQTAARLGDGVDGSAAVYGPYIVGISSCGGNLQFIKCTNQEAHGVNRIFIAEIVVGMAALRAQTNLVAQ